MENAIGNTKYGKVKGMQADGVYVWKGIPYAKAPVGKLRFRPPEDPDSWDGVRDAVQFGSACLQPNSEMMKFLGDASKTKSEDCLYLNIWSPNPDNKRRPVMVWIHGGAFMFGEGSSELYDGTSFAKNGDVVVVTINYRLGIFGFFYLDEIGGDEFSRSGNCGILDQIAALRWVKENIEAFGGDPNNVTVFGESAGAMSIGTLLAIEEAQGLFHKAILQSGASSNVLTTRVANDVTKRLLSELNIPESDLAKLYDIPAEELVKASIKVPPMSLCPVIDGKVIKTKPLDALAQDSAKNIPMLIGTTEDEYRLFTFADPSWRKIDEDKLKRRFQVSFGKKWERLSEELKGKTLDQALYEKLMTWQVFTYPAIALSETRVRQGEQVWMYRFDYKSTAFGGLLKSCHALELPFVWNAMNQKTALFTGDAEGRRELAELMHRSWIAFAKTGNPQIPELPEWPEYELNSRATMHFNLETAVRYDPEKDDRLLWEKIGMTKAQQENIHKDMPSIM